MRPAAALVIVLVIVVVAVVVAAGGCSQVAAPLPAGPGPGRGTGSFDVPSADPAVPELLRAPLPRELVVVPRASWDPAPLDNGVRYPGKLARVYRTIVVHHSDFTDAPGPVVIKDYHLAVSGFSDIGYHFVISPDGTVYEGRPLHRMGAHAGATREAARGLGRDKDPDWGSIGICLDGFFETDGPPEAQLHALGLLIDDLRARFPKIERVIGHREVQTELVDARGLTLLSHATTCPGSALFRTIEDHRIRGDFARKPQAIIKLGAPRKTPVITLSEPPELKASLEVAGADPATGPM